MRYAKLRIATTILSTRTPFFIFKGYKVRYCEWLRLNDLNVFRIMQLRCPSHTVTLTPYIQREKSWLICPWKSPTTRSECQENPRSGGFMRSSTRTFSVVCNLWSRSLSAMLQSLSGVQDQATSCSVAPKSLDQFDIDLLIKSVYLLWSFFIVGQMCIVLTLSGGIWAKNHADLYLLIFKYWSLFEMLVQWPSTRISIQLIKFSRKSIVSVNILCLISNVSSWDSGTAAILVILSVHMKFELNRWYRSALMLSLSWKYWHALDTID